MLENIPRPRVDSRRYGPRIPLTVTGLNILGFGYYRAYSGEPWFKRADLEEAAVEAKLLGVKDNGEVKIPERWYYGDYIKHYVKLGLLHARASEPGEQGPSPRKYVSLSNSGAELMIKSASHSLRYRGEKIPTLFNLPQVAEAIRLDGQLTAYTIAAMEGIELPKPSVPGANSAATLLPKTQPVR